MRYAFNIQLSFLFSTKFRTLIPGGGTDGGSPFMAEQLNHTNSEIVYVDFSKASMSIAQLRTKMRKSHNMVWVTDWLESIPRLGLGTFELVICTGVLHHLKNPQEGLNILNEVQSKYGGASLFVYGKYGRIGVYQIQALLRNINLPIETIDSELGNAKLVLKILPRKHWFLEQFTGDHQTMGDVGIYDILLHKRDVSYSVSDLYKWVKRSGYTFVDFTPEVKNILSLSLRIDDKLLFRQLSTINIPKQQSIYESILGYITKQDFYVTKNNNHGKLGHGKT